MKFYTTRQRLLILLATSLGACLFVVALQMLVGPNLAGDILFDSRSTIFSPPFTIQNLMHLIFLLGFGELFIRWHTLSLEQKIIGERLLPEDAETVLQIHDLPPIRRKVGNRYNDENGFLPTLIDLAILQFMASRSVEQAISVLNSQLELIAHRVDLRYTLLRYIVWVIPTIGFIGTVVGIAWALKDIDPSNPDLAQITSSLGVSFYTTLVALAQSAVLVLAMNLIQSAEEKVVNQAGHYALTNLINRLYHGGG